MALRRPALVQRFCALLAAYFCAAAFADTSREVTFEIPPQPLARALIEFSRQADLQIMSELANLDELGSSGLIGRYSIAGGLQRLLAGNDLVYAETAENTIVVTTAPTANSTVQDDRRRATQMSEQQARDQRRVTSSVQSGEVIVIGRMLDYTLVESANKMPLAVKDTPQSIKVITNDMLEFAGVDNFNDLYKLDAGGHASNSGYRQTYHYSRGFSSSPDGGSSGIRIDGFRTATQFMIDLAAFERIELIKGSTSTLYGPASLAGTMNAITKKPRAATGGKITLEGGSYNWMRGEADFHGALSDDQKLTYRVVGTATNADGYSRGAFDDSYLLAPSAQYQLSAATTARLMLAYERSKTPGNAGIGLVYEGNLNGGLNYRVPDVDRRQQIYPPWAHQTREAFFALGTVEHRFDNDWQLRAAATHYRTSSEMISGYVGLTDAAGASAFVGEWSHATYLSQGLEANLFGTLKWWNREHQLFVGIDFTQFGSQPSKYASARVSDLVPVSIYGTDWSGLPALSPNAFLTGGRFSTLATRYVENTNVRNDQWGITVQFLLQPSDRWSLLLGARRSEVALTEAYAGCSGAETLLNACPSTILAKASRPAMTESRALAASETTVQAGAIFKMTSDINIYASYGQIFEPRDAAAFDPDNPRSIEGRPLGPERGVAHELGLKGMLFDRQLSWSVGIFDIARRNVAIEDPQRPSFVIDRGEQRARGIEVDAQGNVLPGLGVYVSLAHLRNEFTRGALKGFQSNLGPRFGASLFLNYELQAGVLAGLGLGAGGVYKNRVTAYDSENTWPDRTPIRSLSDDILQIDLRAYWHRAAWSYALSATNVLDDKSWSMTRDYGVCCMFPSDGAEVRFSIARQFGSSANR